MLTENFQSSVGVVPSSFTAATTAVEDITDTDTDAVKDINRGRMNQHNVQEEDIEEEEGSEKQASKDTWVAAPRDMTRTTMAMSDDSNDIDGNGAILTKSMMMDMAQRSTMATAMTTATVTLVSGGGGKEEGGISSYPLERVIQPQQPRWQWRDSNDVDDDSNDAMCDDNNNDDNDDDYGNDDGEGNDDINANGVMGSGIQPQGETKIIQTGRQKGLDQIKRDHELMRSRTSEAEKYLQELSEKEAVEKALEKRLRAADEAKQAADEAKQNAFNKFKNDLVFRKERKRQALILAKKLRKLLKHYWFRKHYEVVWRKYSKEKVAASKVAIWLYKNSIRRLRKMKMSAMVSLGQWINSLSPGRMLSNFSQIPSVSAPTSAGAGDVSADDADSAVIVASHGCVCHAPKAAVPLASAGLARRLP